MSVQPEELEWPESAETAGSVIELPLVHRSKIYCHDGYGFSRKSMSQNLEIRRMLLDLILRFIESFSNIDGWIKSGTWRRRRVFPHVQDRTRQRGIEMI